MKKIFELFTQNNYKEDNLIFVNEDLQLETYQSIKFLEKVFMHKTNNEMFIILNMLAKELTAECQNKSIKDWEENIIGFINFGLSYIENKEYLKYSTNLIILVRKGYPLDEIIKIEKSSNICRKIYIQIEDDGQMDREEQFNLPFILEYEKNVEVPDISVDNQRIHESSLVHEKREQKKVLRSINKIYELYKNKSVDKIERIERIESEYWKEILLDE
jgi:hypothetical protein